MHAHPPSPDSTHSATGVVLPTMVWSQRGLPSLHGCGVGLAVGVAVGDELVGLALGVAVGDELVGLALGVAVGDELVGLALGDALGLSLIHI